MMATSVANRDSHLHDHYLSQGRETLIAFNHEQTILVSLQPYRLGDLCQCFTRRDTTFPPGVAPHDREMLAARQPQLSAAVHIPEDACLALAP
jgi:hypothetical protein